MERISQERAETDRRRLDKQKVLYVQHGGRA